MSSEKILDISWGAILKILVAIIGLYVIYRIHTILIFFIFALIISILFASTIDFFQKFKLPRILAVSLAYFLVLGLISLSIYALIPLFVSETHQFIQLLPNYVEKLVPPLRGIGIEAFETMEDFVTLLGNTLEEMAATIFNALFALFGGIFETFFILTIAFFLSLEGDVVKKALIVLFPKKHEDYVLSLWTKSRESVSNWFLSRVFSSLFIAVAYSLILLLFNVRYPLFLGLLAGILNFIPFIGPLIVGAIVFMLVALTNIFQAAIVLVILTLVQTIENNIVTPLLTKRIVGLSPVLVLFSMTVGGILWGFLGAILAIPLAGILFEFFKEFLQRKREQETIIL